MTPLLGSLANANDSDVITVVGQGTTAHYEFSDAGSVETSGPDITGNDRYERHDY